VELSGREGFNSIAVNGVWKFWRVKNGRLAFRRDVELEAEGEDIEEEGCSDDSANQTGGGQSGSSTVRLFLFYASQVDSWLISTTSDASGSVTADCGPVGNGEDLGSNWRVWDGERWCEDRNVNAEVALGSTAFPNLKGLRVVAAPGAKQRAVSQDSRTSCAPSFERAQDSARRRRTPR
jgi:hypothetical protein